MYIRLILLNMRLMKIMTNTDFDEATSIVCLSFKLYSIDVAQSVVDYNIVSLEFGYCKLCVCLRAQTNYRVKKKKWEKRHIKTIWSNHQACRHCDFMISHSLFSFEVSYREKKGERLKSIFWSVHPKIKISNNEFKVHTCEIAKYPWQMYKMN